MHNSYRRHRQLTGTQKTLAQSLGWFSIGLGLAEVFASRSLSKLIGVRPPAWLVPTLGLREITSGIGILSQEQPTGWLWSRVAGDMMDLGLLGTAYFSDDSDEPNLEAAAAAVAGVTVLDLIAAVQHTRAEESSVRFRRAITVDRSPQELYRFWRDFENLPRVMRYLVSVRSIGGTRSHWVARGPAGKSVEWDAEITEDQPNVYLSWRSLPGADVDNSGSVTFDPAPGNRGTIVRVELEYTPPGGIFGATIAKLFGRSPEQEIRVDLYRLKQLLETGEITTTEGQPAARPTSTSPIYDHGTTRA